MTSSVRVTSALRPGATCSPRRRGLAPTAFPLREPELDMGGRPAGSIAWAGLANLCYWIDRANDIGGFWGRQIFPFADPTSVGGYLEFETASYRALEG